MSKRDRNFDRDPSSSNFLSIFFQHHLHYPSIVPRPSQTIPIRIFIPPLFGHSYIMPRRPQQTNGSSVFDNPLSIDARARLATSSVALVTRTFRSGDTQVQYQNKQKHWKAWCQQQKFSTGYVNRPRKLDRRVPVGRP